MAVEPLATLRLASGCVDVDRTHPSAPLSDFSWYERQWFFTLASPADRIVESWFRSHRCADGGKKVKKKKVHSQ